LDIAWKAIYSNGSEYKQYPSSGAENTFAKVEKSQPKIFMVGKKYGVNLETGAFLIDGKWYQVGSKEGVWRKPLKLIYYRHNQVEYTVGERVKRIGILTITLPPAKPKKVVCDSYFGYEYATGKITICIPMRGNPTICIGE
jgi:hypothetical protein